MELDNIQRMMSLRQFAQRIGKTYPTVLRMRNKGDVQVIKIGGIYHVTEAELRRILSEGNFNPVKS